MCAHYWLKMQVTSCALKRKPKVWVRIRAEVRVVELGSELILDLELRLGLALVQNFHT